MTFHLYRLYDAAGALLYIGQTAQLKQRVYNLRYMIADVQSVSYETREVALQAECAAIKAERPKFNRTSRRVPGHAGSDVPGKAAKRRAASLAAALGVVFIEEDGHPRAGLAVSPNRVSPHALGQT